MAIAEKVRENILVRTFKEFGEDDGPRAAAALAYYTVFSLPPILAILMMVAGVFADPAEVTSWIQNQLGSETGEAVGAMVESANQQAGSGGLSVAVILGLAGLIFSATGAFVQLQKALNDTWDVEPDSEEEGGRKVLHMVVKRLVSLGMILVIALLVLIAMVVSGAISTFSESIVEYMEPLGMTPAASQLLLWAADAVVSLIMFSLLIAAIFMVLPDVKVGWKDVRVGAFVTAILFVIGKIGIGWYIGSSSPGDPFGAAGALAAILVFVYYASMILLFGAEFTQLWARRNGEGIRPTKHAVRVVEEKRRVE